MTPPERDVETIRALLDARGNEETTPEEYDAGDAALARLAAVVEALRRLLEMHSDCDCTFHEDAWAALRALDVEPPTRGTL